MEDLAKRRCQKPCDAITAFQEDNPTLVGDAIPVRVPLTHEGNPNVMGNTSVKEKVVQSDGAASNVGESSNHQVLKPLGTNSFASVLQTKPNKRVVKIIELRNEENVEGAAVAIPFEAVEEVSSRFTNTLYGYFIGKRLAFRLVENYVKNTWSKYGLKRVQLHDDFFLFQFENKEGMEKVLENGPWLIRTVPLILNVWSPNTDLEKAGVKKAPVWIKLHHIPIVAYLEIGLSLITTQLGKPIMLDSYTSSMCLNSWGKCTYARALIEVSAENELMESLVIAIPVGKDKGHTLATIDVEYEWKPPRCSTCLIFDHITDKCPKLPKEVPAANDLDDGFGESSVKQNNDAQSHPKVSNSEVTTKNSFEILDEEGKEDEMYSDPMKKHKEVLNVSDSEVDEEILVDDQKGVFISNFTKPGASTPVTEVSKSHVVDSNLHRLCSLVFKHWDWASNGAWCDKGIRIIGTIMRYNQRRSLWRSLSKHKVYVRDRPWCILGDFNVALFMEDSTTGGSSIDIAMRDFRDCVEDIEVMDVQRTGLNFTWSQKPKGNNGILKKLDWVMANLSFIDQFVGAHAIFKPYRLSDHSPLVLSIPMLSNLHANVNQARAALDSIQSSLDADPFNTNLREAEAALKSRVSRSRIDAVTNAEGVVFENSMVPDIFVSHYETFLGLAGEMRGFNGANLFKTCLNEQVASDIVRNVTAQEVKEVLFSMGDDKSPGPDGYMAAFFKDAWDVVANDVTNAICEFFRNGTLKEYDHCSYSEVRSLLIDLMHIYHLDRGTPRCAFKVDIQKAYDTVEWDFLRVILHGFGFHDRMISWIMECVTTTSYSICINGSLHGYFQGKRGLRQGDPLSPYLFTLVMEVLTLLQRKVQESDLFTYHRYCSKLELINLCFADDLFLFAYGDVQSASIIKEWLDEFKEASGLIPSLPKSTAYFCNVLNHIKLSILQILPFEEGKLPVKYLGVPLVSSRLMIRDCNELIDRVQIRIQDWKNKSLSIAGRL
ncbi:hypothetical protein Tco_1101468 [Tanacetum coccineum]